MNDALYREFAPCGALRDYVSAFFSFAPLEASPRRAAVREVRFNGKDSFSSPLFADAQVSWVFSFEQGCRPGGPWHSGGFAPRADVIGPTTAAGTTVCEELPEMVGVYFRAGRSYPFIGFLARELKDRIVPFSDLKKSGNHSLLQKLKAARDGKSRIELLESALLARLAKAQAFDVQQGIRLAEYVLRSQGQMTIEALANAAGVSRQHLTKSFHNFVGLCPKFFCRLARFRRALTYAARGENVDWAQAAIESGYYDQSHMISEFREFSSFTPRQLASPGVFHPFIGRAV